jgi:hypothetical protein
MDFTYSDIRPSLSITLPPQGNFEGGALAGDFGEATIAAW